MPILVANCPRCGSGKMTFDVSGFNDLGAQYNWQRWYELFSVCRQCSKSTTFVVSQRTGGDINAFRDPEAVMRMTTALNDRFQIERFISLRDQAKHSPPDFVSENIAFIFTEGATCLSVECWNAAGTMFRQCLDLVTKSLLPKEAVDGLTEQHRRNLGKRLGWLFKNQKLPSDLESLAACIREDGNDGAHDGTLKEADALDLLEFTTALLERVFTEPEKLRQAEARRMERRAI